MLSVKRFTFNPLAEHTYVVYDETKSCAIIDPGCLESDEQKKLSDFIQEQGLHVQHLINTHCHIDHIVGNAYIKRTYGVKLAIHPADLELMRLAGAHAPRYGIFGYEPTTPDIFVAAGDFIQVGNHQLKVLHVPGHSPGHIALYCATNQICFVGDVLFKNYVGRTDLPGGDYDVLLKSIHEQLFKLDDQVTLYPGHGANTTIGVEKRNNPFVGARLE
ncbi:MAG: MBL fold hydrolase [Candidatus Amoebophilus sp. 36-38]|nr:MAG: MBL fold hydrolase [Candidatus Amoebophilus sp. 36-38]